MFPEFYDVTSNNQSGGITAGKVVFDRKPPRTMESLREGHFADQLRQLLKQKFNDTYEWITISTVANDGEAYEFALHLFDYLDDEGFQTRPRAKRPNVHMIFGKQPEPLTLQKGRDGQPEIIVGSQR